MRILFICNELYERPAKFAFLLKKENVSVNVIFQKLTEKSFLENFDNAIFCENSKDLGKCIDREMFDLIHYFSKGVDDFSIQLIKMKVPFVYDYKDLFERMIKKAFDQKIYQIQKHLIDLSIGVTYRDTQYQDYIQRNNYTPNKNNLFLPDTISHATINNLEIEPYNVDSICFGGNFVIEKKEPQYEGQGQIEIAKAVIEQGYKYHMYPFRHNFNDMDQQLMSDYHKLSYENNNFILHSRLPFIDFIDQISTHHFGSLILPFLHFKHLNNKHYIIEPISGMPSRIFDYISAGIPIIIDREFIEPSKFIAENNIGISLDRGELFDIKKVINNYNYIQLKSNVIELRNHIFENNYPTKSLILFYEEIINDINYEMKRSNYFLKKIFEIIRN